MSVQNLGECSICLTEMLRGQDVPIEGAVAEAICESAHHQNQVQFRTQHGFNFEVRNSVPHYFHVLCLKNWLEQNSDKTCPQCRQNIRVAIVEPENSDSSNKVSETRTAIKCARIGRYAVLLSTIGYGIHQLRKNTDLSYQTMAIYLACSFAASTLTSLLGAGLGGPSVAEARKASGQEADEFHRILLAPFTAFGFIMKTASSYIGQIFSR